MPSAQLLGLVVVVSVAALSAEKEGREQPAQLEQRQQQEQEGEEPAERELEQEQEQNQEQMREESPAELEQGQEQEEGEEPAELEHEQQESVELEQDLSEQMEDDAEEASAPRYVIVEEEPLEAGASGGAPNAGQDQDQDRDQDGEQQAHREQDQQRRQQEQTVDETPDAVVPMYLIEEPAAGAEAPMARPAWNPKLMASTAVGGIWFPSEKMRWLSDHVRLSTTVRLELEVERWLRNSSVTIDVSHSPALSGSSAPSLWFASWSMGLLYRFGGDDVRSRLVPYGRVAVETTVTRVKYVHLSRTAVLFGAQAGVGLRVRLSRATRSAVQLYAFAEGGCAWRQKRAMRLKPSGDRDESLGGPALRLGKIDLSARMLVAGMGLRF